MSLEMNQRPPRDHVNSVLMSFLKTGQLGPLRCGLSREEVRLFLGDPQSYDGKESVARDWRYDSLSVYFEEQLVVGYGVGFCPGRPLPTCINGLASPAYFEISTKDFFADLKSAGIEFEPCKEIFRTEAGVLIFSDTKENLMNLLFTSADAPSLWNFQKYHNAATRKSTSK